MAFSLAFNNTVTRAGVDDNRTIDNLWPKDAHVTISNVTSTYTVAMGAKTSDFTVGESPSLSSDVATSLSPIADDGNFIWPTTNPNWSFSAWYPAGDHPQMNITVAADQTVWKETSNPNGLKDAEYNAYDLLYCPSTTVTFRQKPVTLNFLHQLARVVVIVNSNYTEDKGEVTAVEFGGGKVALSGSIQNLGTTGANGATTWTTGTQNSTIKMRDHSTDDEKASHVYTYECMLPPQASDGTVSNLVKIYSHGTQKGERTFKTSDMSFEMKAGYQYTYNLLISEQGVITLATVMVTDWETGQAVGNTATIPNNSYPTNAVQ